MKPFRWQVLVLLLRCCPMSAQIPVRTPGIMAGEVLSLPGALQIAVENFQLLKAKENMANASRELVEAARKDARPDVSISVETAYGTLSGLNGLSSGLPGITTLTSGPPTASQNWNAAFGGLYVSDIKWNVYSFGLQHSHVAAARGQYDQDVADLRQEKFQQAVRVSGAYLDLLAAQRLRMTMEDNVLRAVQLREIILRRAENGLNPGVDSSIANAELSRARLSLMDAELYEKSLVSHFAVQLGVTNQAFLLDSTFFLRLPKGLADKPLNDIADRNPSLQYLQSRVMTSDLNAEYIRRTGLPRVSLFAVMQGRGSGFGRDYSTNKSDYSTAFFDGIRPIRTNYLVGLAVTWSVTDLSKIQSRVAAQRWSSAALRNEYNWRQNQLTDQLALADQQIAIALAKYREAPIQLNAARAAYRQKEALYENGLTTLVDVAQAMYILNRAEIDESVACNAVWQAELQRASAAGDMELFLKQL